MIVYSPLRDQWFRFSLKNSRKFYYHDFIDRSECYSDSGDYIGTFCFGGCYTGAEEKIFTLLNQANSTNRFDIVDVIIHKYHSPDGRPFTLHM